MAKLQGSPCWYELCTAKGALDGAGTFYGEVFGWSVEDAGMEDFTYHLAAAGGDLVAGLMEIPDDAGDMPPFWLVYFAVEDADAASAAVEAAGGKVYKAPADIPGTGRFAVLGDPQGAGFGVLAPAPMADGPPAGNAFGPGKPGHGCWHELMTTDPAAGFDFYAGLFGWEKGRPVDMGEMGTYQLFIHDGAEIGGMMGLGEAPVPCWLPYFATDDLAAAMARITAAGGAVMHGPMEVPGDEVIAVATDPQGAWFALAGPRT